MKPESFDQITAREVVTDEFARIIESKARFDADINKYDPPVLKTNGTYWDSIHNGMRTIVYYEQYKKRIARNERKIKNETEKSTGYI